MAEDKKLVEAITSMKEDFAQWYTEEVVLDSVDEDEEA